MPYANNGDIRIYYEIEGSGPPLVLDQALAFSYHTARKVGYIDALKDEFTLILADVRGVGRSSRPHSPASYSRQEVVGDTTAILDALRIDRAHYWGYRAGATRGWYAAHYAPERLISVVVGSGQVPDIGLDLAMPQNILDSIQQEGADFVVRQYRKRAGSDVEPEIEQAMRAQDWVALHAAWSVVQPLDLQATLPQLGVPLLGYAGDQDPMHDTLRRFCKLAPLGRFISMPDASQIIAYQQMDRILPEVVKFLHQAETGLERATT